jgi:TonB-linked SusC/RagA family outer membrane protein
MNSIIRYWLISTLFVFCFSNLSAQSRTITGRVSGPDGSGVSRASVTVKNESGGTATDESGNYSISVPASATTLIFSAVGFTTQEVTISSDVVNVVFAGNTGNLNEVVIIGYGTSRVKDVTGSVTPVTARDFVKGAITSPDQLIAGKVAGVQINSNSGQPGAGSRIRIRGGTSLNASNDPLVVVDGVPLDNETINGAPSPLSTINPNDIESMTILKDASAAAIYGSRGANGVILITTKRGTSGALNVNFNTLNSASFATDYTDVLSADEFREIVNSRGNDAERSYLGNTATDWQRQIFKTAFASDNNISLSGGIDGLPYRLSLGYLNQQGILKTSSLERYALTLGLSPKFLDNHLSVNANAKLSLSKNRFAERDAISAAINYDPTQPVYSGKPEYGGYQEWLNAAGEPNGLSLPNPLGLLEMRNDRGDVSRFIGNIQIDYKFHFLPALHFNINAGLDRTSAETSIFIPEYASFVFARRGVNNRGEQEKFNKLLETYLNYNSELQSIKSVIDVVGGYTYQDWLRKSPSFPDLRANGDTLTPAGIPFETQNTLVSFYGRLKYTFDDRFSATITYRRDGSSRFNKDNRWGDFPSVGVAWNIKEERFLQLSKVVSNLRLRASWGITGQQDIGSDYGYQPNIFYGDSAAQYPFGRRFYAVARPAAFDANLKWEETEGRNIAIDAGFLENRFTLSVEYYEKTTTDLLATVPAPAGTNFSNQILTNVGELKNKGWEFSLGVNAIRNDDVRLDFSGNFTYLQQNDIVRLQLVNDPTYLGADVGYSGFNALQKLTVGHRPYTWFLYKQVYDRDNKPIEGLYDDRNRDGNIDELDKYWVKTPEPRFFVGFSANASYKKWSAGFTARGSYGNYVYNVNKAASGVLQNVLPGQTFLSNAHADLAYTGFARRQTWSDYYLENGSFIRMDNINVNYDAGRIPSLRADLRVSLNIQNAFLISKYSGLDPEVNGGIDEQVYPRPTTIAIGLQASF